MLICYRDLKAIKYDFGNCYRMHLLLKMVLTEAYQAPVFPSGRDRDGFNLGCYENIVEVFGQNKWLWLLPLHSRFIM